MRLLLPFCPVAFCLERDELGSMWGFALYRCQLQFHFGDWTLAISRD